MKQTYTSLSRWLGAGLLGLLALAAPRAQAQTATGLYYTQGSSTATLDALKSAPVAGGTGTALVAGSPNFSQPTDVVVDAAGGFVYVADQYVGTGAIYRYRTDGTGRTKVVSEAAGVTYNGLALDVAGNRLYFTQAGASQASAALRVVSLAGTLPATATSVATLPATMTRPGDLALDAAAGVLYVADQLTGSASGILRVVISSKAVTTALAGTANATYNGLALDAANNRLYFTQGSATATLDALKVLNLTTAAVTTLASGSADFSQPGDLAFSPGSGQLYLADQYVGTGALLRYTVAVNSGTVSVSNRTLLVAPTAGAAYSGLALALTPAQPPVLVASSGAVTAPEQVATTIDAGITATDADNATLASGTVSISNGLVSAEDALSFTASAATYGNIAGTYNAGTGVLTLTSAGATATLAQWQAALRSVSYRNSSDAPTTTARTVSFVVNDGTQNSNVATRTVNVQAVNDAPVNTVPGAQTTPYATALTFSVANGNAISVADVDAGGAAEQLTLTATNGTLTLGTTTGLTFTAGTGTANATMTFSGPLASLNAALSGLRFQPAAGFGGAASIQLVTNDLGNTGTGGALTATSTIALTVGAPAIAITPATLPGGTVGTTYSQTLAAAGGASPYTYGVTAGALPAGLALTASGVLGGTPTAGGTFNFTVTATDASTGSGPFAGSQTYALVITAPTITVAPAALPGGTVGVAYSQAVVAAGGTSPYTYALTTGALPPGLALSASGGLSGKPTAAGTFTFSVTSTDASTGTGPYTASQAYTLLIGGAPLPVTLTQFTAQLSGRVVQLDWQTASEVNSDHFVVERSLDGRTFGPLQSVRAAGTSTLPHSYAALDAQALATGAPQLYYRLRSVDQDGTSAYSPVQAVALPLATGLALFPNPATTTTTLVGAPAGSRIQVLDALGRVIITATADANGTAELVLPAGSAGGVYIVRTGSQALRLLVNK